MADSNPVIQLLLTGNEIMSGDTVDSNSAMIAQRLAQLGLSVQRKVTVGDDPALLRRELAQLSRDSDVVIVNGGLGPTIDDLTAQVLADVSGQPLREHPQARAHLEQWCARRNAPLNAANLKQAMLPAAADIIDNPIGSAVGFQQELNDCLIICTPGVPSELRLMLDPVTATLAQRLGKTAQVEIIRLQTFGLGESSAQQIISDAAPDWPDDVDLGFRAGAPQLEVKLTITDAAFRAQQQGCREQLYELLGDHIIGEGSTTLAQRVLQLLQEQGKTIPTAESCTGGLIASMLTQVPGSSTGFHAGFVTYANHIKHSVLGVEEAALAEHGAVSEAVVIQMAEGALRRSGADYAIAVSGVAGPDGGTEDKPVGTVWLAWGSAGQISTRGLCWPVERTLFQTMIAAAGLDMIRRRLLGLSSEPNYFRQRATQVS
ncbi:MAG: CinA family nicotinamide mononucleotide deamidase-related protein [Gammaproteobacteria bacterium]|nr:CinA family nicotinamide mononucleotide deamidase-related protein [Gammaproteobacteria bacterium]